MLVCLNNNKYRYKVSDAMMLDITLELCNYYDLACNETDDGQTIGRNYYDRETGEVYIVLTIAPNTHTILIQDLYNYGISYTLESLYQEYCIQYSYLY